MKSQLKIIFEDECLMVVDKAGGLVVHSDGRTEELTLVDLLKENFPELQNVGNPHTLDSGRYEDRWGIVNRLDRDTSGVILIAKNDEYFSYLQKQFLKRTVVKEYIALLWGHLTEEKLTIAESLSRHKKDPRLWVLKSEKGSRPTTRDAETFLELIENKTGGFSKKNCLVKLFPKTGRTHQLRLHCRFIGHPIVGDIKYGVNGISNEHDTSKIDSLLKTLTEKEKEFDKNCRLMLHAKSLEFLHPKTFKVLKVECDMPKEFSEN